MNAKFWYDNAMNEEIKKIRDQIDIIDSNILQLLINRADLVLEVFESKINSNPDKEKLFSSEREQEILSKLSKQNVGSFDKVAIDNIFKAIINESRRLQSAKLE